MGGPISRSRDFLVWFHFAPNCFRLLRAYKIVGTQRNLFPLIKYSHHAFTKNLIPHIIRQKNSSRASNGNWPCTLLGLATYLDWRV